MTGESGVGLKGSSFKTSAPCLVRCAASVIGSQRDGETPGYWRVVCRGLAWVVSSALLLMCHFLSHFFRKALWLEEALLDVRETKVFFSLGRMQWGVYILPVSGSLFRSRARADGTLSLDVMERRGKDWGLGARFVSSRCVISFPFVRLRQVIYRFSSWPMNWTRRRSGLPFGVTMWLDREGFFLDPFDTHGRLRRLFRSCLHLEFLGLFIYGTCIGYLQDTRLHFIYWNIDCSIYGFGHFCSSTTVLCYKIV